MSSSLCLWVKLALELEAQQILDQVAFFAIRESQVHAAVVMVDHGVQISKPSVVIEAAFEVGRQCADRGSSIAHIRSTICLEAVNADFAGLM